MQEKLNVDLWEDLRVDFRRRFGPFRQFSWRLGEVGALEELLEGEQQGSGERQLHLQVEEVWQEAGGEDVVQLGQAHQGL